MIDTPFCDIAFNKEEKNTSQFEKNKAAIVK